MTLQEIKNLYKDIFVLTVENNKIIDDVNAVIEEYNADKFLNKDEVNFEGFVGLLITLVILKIHGPEKLSEKDSDEMEELINDFYNRHLKTITKKFASKYGVSLDNEELKVSAKIVKFNKNE